MANSVFESFGSTAWWTRVVVTATGTATLMTVPAGTAAAVSQTNRIVLLGYSIVGHNTNAAATVFTIRSSTTTANVLLGGSMIPLTGSLSMSSSNVFLPATANESLQLNVTGAITGQIDVTLFGRIIDSSAPLALRYTGSPT